MNGGSKWVFGVISSLLILWLAWTSSATVSNTTDVAVMKSQMIEIRCNIGEIKDLTREIRDDQRRIQRRDEKNGR